LGFAIACSNLAIRPAFLAPNPPPLVDSKGERVIRTYERDFDYFCLYFAPTISSAPEWFCATGNLADGVTGIAAKQAASNPSSGASSPATFFLNQIQWGPNTWSKHWEFPHGLGAVVSRIPGLEQTGFAKDYQWNLNPNDSHADGTRKATDYIAAVGVKTATNRNGVNVSPYNTRHVVDFFNANPANPLLDTLAYAALADPGELNQAEVERRSCGTGDTSLCFGYFSKPDVASTGTTGHSGYGVVDITVGPYHVNNPLTCSWAQDWGFSAFDLFQGGSVRPPPPIGGSAQSFLDQYPVALANSDFKVAINLGDNEIARCPSWSVCQNGPAQRQVNLYRMDDTTLGFAQLPALGVEIRVDPASAACIPASGLHHRCRQFLCGRSATVAAIDGSTVFNWWLCSGDSCRHAGAVWRAGCRNSLSCSVSLADYNIHIVAVSPVIDDSSAEAALQANGVPD